jgi:FAD/FMN-containing dehydrogenase
LIDLVSTARTVHKRNSKVLQYCYQKRIAVVPQGGNTGLVGGGVPLYDDSRMAPASAVRIPFDRSCQHGEDSSQKKRGRWTDLGAKGSCHIGGNISTNAGGLRLLRYGSLHGTVLAWKRSEHTLEAGKVLTRVVLAECAGATSSRHVDAPRAT